MSLIRAARTEPVQISTIERNGRETIFDQQPLKQNVTTPTSPRMDSKQECSDCQTRPNSWASPPVFFYTRAPQSPRPTSLSH